ncbi:hypothetical protein EYF80_010761 [Liparis tanakae]|uniref:Uncharacterized protein n=1 Tax=Liparis tanakae TaxID=230148 RepID=A0A4Z2IPD8_9TELE|nr:hypothetical protein EYF80_010761 [Liparis tanakae]
MSCDAFRVSPCSVSDRLWTTSMCPLGGWRTLFLGKDVVLWFTVLSNQDMTVLLSSSAGKQCAVYRIFP